MAARIRARLAQEDGYTLIELLTSMAILAFVLTAILGMFVSGLNAEVDMNNRFQAQQNARLALTTMRQDIRTACAATVAPSGASVTLSDSCATISGRNNALTGQPGYVAGNVVNVDATADNGLWEQTCSAKVASDGSWLCHVTLTAAGGSNYHYTATSTDANGNPISETSTFTSTAPVETTWCADSSSGNAPYGLYRQTGESCASNNGIRKASYLTTASVFVPLTAAQMGGTRPGLQVYIQVDASPKTQGTGVYTLSDTVMLRNAPPAS